jgi:SNF2 family DNA or RNA helicase
LMLSATPCETHEHLYHLLYILDPIMFQHFHHHQPKLVHRLSKQRFYFAERYTVPKVVYLGHGRTSLDYRTNIRSEELRFITSHLMVYKDKSVLNLPPLTKEYITVHQGSSKSFTAFKVRLEKVRLEKGTKAADHMLLAEVRKTGTVKIPYVLQYIDTLGCTSCIIFTWSLEMQEAIVGRLAHNHISHININGSTPMKDREDILDRHRTGVVQVAVLSMLCCSTGLNLQHCQFAIYTELCFDSIVMRQSESRCHRNGVVGSVSLVYLVTGHSTDDMVLGSLRNKERVSNNIFRPTIGRPTHQSKKRRVDNDDMITPLIY